MIFLHDRKLIYVGTPKSGTHSMEALLVERFGGELVPGIDYHSREVPVQLIIDGYRTFSAVRHPESRAVSIWHHITRRDPYCNWWLPRLTDDSLTATLKYLVAHRDKRVPGLRGEQVLYSQVRWLRDLATSFVLRLETLVVDLVANGFAATDADAYHKNWDPYEQPDLTDEQRALIRLWAADDYRWYE